MVRASIGESARVLGEARLTSAAGERAVRQAMLNHPYTESTLVATKDGIVAMVVPDGYAGTVGSDISFHLETGRSIREPGADRDERGGVGDGRDRRNRMVRRHYEGA